jgi:hypothetical protein
MQRRMQLKISITINRVLTPASFGNRTRVPRLTDGCVMLLRRMRHAYPNRVIMLCVARKILALVRILILVLADITNGVLNKTEKINVAGTIWRSHVTTDIFIRMETMPRRVAERKGMTVAHATPVEFVIINR